MKQKDIHGENNYEKVNFNLSPVRGKNVSLLVNSISFSSSIEMGKLMPTCPRRK